MLRSEVIYLIDLVWERGSEICEKGVCAFKVMKNVFY